MRDDIVINLRGGRYEIGRTLEFTAVDSGTNGHFITCRSYPGERAIISGGKRIAGWTKVEGKPYWVASVPTSSGFADYFRQIYVNGVRAERARSNWVSGAAYYDDPATAETVDGISFKSADLKDYSNVTDLRLLHIASFKIDEFPILAIHDDPANGLKHVQLQQPYCQIRFNRKEGSFDAGDQWMIVPAVEELDEPGEWALNRATHQVFYYPYSYENMANAEVFAPAVEKLLSLKGSSGAKVRNLIFQDLVFEHGNWLFPRDYFIGGTQAEMLFTPPPVRGYGFEVPGQIVLNHTDNVRFTGNIFRHLGSCGIQVYNGALNTEITGNVFHDLTAAAVIVGRCRSAETDNDIPDEALCTHTVITNNLIRGIGSDFLAGTAINHLGSRNFQVAHNDIADTPYMGIHQRNEANTLEGVNGIGECLIESNRITLANTGARYGVGDGGFVYSYGSWPGSRIEGNDLRTVNRGNVSGLYMDNNSAGFQIRNNVIRDVVQPGTWSYKLVRSVKPSAVVADNNFYDSGTIWTKGATVTRLIRVQNQKWPEPAMQTMRTAGLEPRFRNLLSGFHEGTDLVRGKRAWASGQYGSKTPPAAAADWNFNTMWHSPKSSGLSWWAVDLGSPHVIQRLEICARLDMDQPNARKDFQVQGSNDSDFRTFSVLSEQNDVPFAYRKPGLTNSWVKSINTPQAFRYLRVIKTAPGTLNFSEFQAYGYPASGAPGIQPESLTKNSARSSPPSGNR